MGQNYAFCPCRDHVEMCNLLRHAPSNYVSMGCTNYTLSKERGPTISDGMSLILFGPAFLFLPTTGVLVMGRNDDHLAGELTSP